jgi:oligosaccharyltransferase complex subunit alpha (ribophorin I)
MCRDLNMELPFEATSGQSRLHFTYLDTFGRPVVVYHKNNLVEQHIQEFEVCLNRLKLQGLVHCSVI